MLKINFINETPFRLPRKLLTQILTAAYQAQAKKAAVMNILVVGDRAIKKINAQFLHHNYSTDVITFADAQTFWKGKLQLGEVVVNAALAQRIAKTNGWAWRGELALYALHGLLHIIGYDDRTSRARQKMTDAQQHWLRKFGVCLAC